MSAPGQPGRPSAPGRNIAGAVQALLFASSAPLSLDRLCALTGATPLEVRRALTEIASHLDGPSAPRGVTLQPLAGGWQITTAPAYGEEVAALVRARTQPLSPAALETLAVVAYEQPVTRAEIEAVRGVKVEGVLATLFDRDLVREAGRKNAPGRPVLYATTSEFLRMFGLSSLSDLPEIPPAAIEDAASGTQSALPSRTRSPH